MKYLFFTALVMLFLFSCQQSSKDPVAPVEDEKNFSIKDLAKGTLSSNLTLLEPGYTAFTLVDGLITPEGTTLLPLDRKLLIGQSIEADIMTVNLWRNVSQYAKIPYEEPPEPALIDIIHIPFRGVFTTLLRHGKIFKIDRAGNVSEFASGLNYPLFMEKDMKLNLYVSELYGSCITKFDKYGNRTKMIEFEEDWRPRGIVFDREWRLYILSYLGEIWRFDVKNATSYPMTLNDGILIATVPAETGPQDLTFGFSGDLFVVTESEVFRVKLTGEVTNFAYGLDGPYNTINSTFGGELMVSDYAGGQVIGIIGFGSRWVN